MLDSAPPIKASELFRERAVARYLTQDCYKPAAGLDVVDQDSRSKHGFVPRSGSDTALTAFAQLAALRLNTSRAIISLIDSKHQFVLAEATPSLSSQLDSRHASADALWLGNVVAPRKSLICEAALSAFVDSPSLEAGIESEDVQMLEINDLRQDARFQQRPYVLGSPNLRFYAGVPIRTADGVLIGVYAVLDSRPRESLSLEIRLFMRDMASTIMNYLESARVRADHTRREKLVRGLESFVDGLGSLRSEQNDPRALSRPEPEKSPRPLQTAALDEANSTPAELEVVAANNKNLWELALPADSTSMFQRASAILRQSSDYDGVIFFHMSSAASPNQNSKTTKSYTSEARKQSIASSAGFREAALLDPDLVGDPTGVPTTSGETSDTDASSQGFAAILGFSTSHFMQDRPSQIPQMTNRELVRIMGKRLKGRVFALSKQGSPLPGDTSSSASGADRGPDDSTAHLRKKARINTLLKLDSQARSFAALPLWDFERQRWFAICICWTRSFSRDFALDGDLSYLRIFSTLAMHSLAHLDALEADRAKTTFISSISHELRSPLHGILGGASFLSDTPLDSFQRELLDSVTNCGHTLQSTLAHVMDRVASDSKSSPITETDLSLVLEEVVEACYMGFTFKQDYVQMRNVEGVDQVLIESGSRHFANRVAPGPRRGFIRIVLRIESHDVARVRTQPGAWRRIVMNLFGNAIKYTNEGLVTVSLRVTGIDEDSGNPRMTLEVTDTGRGISQDFQQNHLFKPFSQESSFSAGSGLGLSIVKTLVSDAGGKLDLSSTKGTGTKVLVSIPVSPVKDGATVLEPSESLSEVRRRLRGKRICVLASGDLTVAVAAAAKNHELEHISSIVDTIRDWFQVDAFVESTCKPDMADLVICSEPSFKHLESMRSWNSSQISTPPVLFVAYDALEMSVLRSDVRITSLESIVEVTSQPCGPRKLTKALLQILDRHDDRSITNTASKPAISRHNSPGRFEIPKHPRRWVSAPSTPATQSTLNFDSHVMLPILAVDDNEINLKLLSAFIKKSNFSCVQATDGLEAVNFYKQARGDFLCVLMDISMPVLDGIAATRAIREYEKEEGLSRTKVIALTGLASAAARYEAQDAGVDVYMTKPVSFPQLGELLQESVLEHQNILSDT